MNGIWQWRGMLASQHVSVDHMWPCHVAYSTYCKTDLGISYTDSGAHISHTGAVHTLCTARKAIRLRGEFARSPHIGLCSPHCYSWMMRNGAAHSMPHSGQLRWLFRPYYPMTRKRLASLLDMSPRHHLDYAPLAHQIVGVSAVGFACWPVDR